MSIEKEKINNCEIIFNLTCDCCGGSESFYTFKSAVEFKKKNDWKSKHINNEYWEDYCENCKEDE